MQQIKRRCSGAAVAQCVVGDYDDSGSAIASAVAVGAAPSAASIRSSGVTRGTAANGCRPATSDSSRACAARERAASTAATRIEYRAACYGAAESRASVAVAPYMTYRTSASSSASALAAEAGSAIVALACGSSPGRGT